MRAGGQTLLNYHLEGFFVFISIHPAMVCSKVIWFVRLAIARGMGGKNSRLLRVGPQGEPHAFGRRHSGKWRSPLFFEWIFLKDGVFEGLSGHWLSRSSDMGKNWIVDTDPIVPEGNRRAIPFGRIIRMSDNRLAYSCYRSQGKGNPSETWIGFSEDDGISWTKRTKFGKNDSNESTLLQVADGRLLAAVRTHNDHHVKLCESLNGGKTWREKGPLTLPMQHPADLIALTDRCLLLTYGIRNRGLMGIGARISLDAGETWRPPWVIHQFGDQATSVGYPSTVALDVKGNLLTAFYTDYEPSLGIRAERYRVLGMRWSIGTGYTRACLIRSRTGRN